MEHVSSGPAMWDPDVRLMLRVRDEDDTAAFAELIERFWRRLVVRMRHRVGRAEEAEDLAQEAFLRVYRSRKTYTPKAEFATWLFTIAHYLSLKALRARPRRPVLRLELADIEPVGPDSRAAITPTRDVSPCHNLRQQELSAVIRRALDLLTEREREAVVLNSFEDKNYADVAAVMGISTMAVKSMLHRARSKLREKLRDRI